MGKNKQQVLVLSKKSAALRQLEAAIELHFYDGDPVAIHTLTAASYNLLRDLGRKSNKHDPFHEMIEFAVRPDERAAAYRILRGPQNFLKHADRDASKSLKFRLSINPVWLWFTCVHYCTVTKTRPSKSLATYSTWFAAHFPAIVDPEMLKAIPPSDYTTRVIAGMPKSLFFEMSMRRKLKDPRWKFWSQDHKTVAYRHDGTTLAHLKRARV